MVGDAHRHILYQRAWESWISGERRELLWRGTCREESQMRGREEAHRTHQYHQRTWEIWMCVKKMMRERAATNYPRVPRVCWTGYSFLSALFISWVGARCWTGTQNVLLASSFCSTQDVLLERSFIEGDLRYLKSQVGSCFPLFFPFLLPDRLYHTPFAIYFSPTFLPKIDWNIQCALVIHVFMTHNSICFQDCRFHLRRALYRRAKPVFKWES